MDKDTRNVYFSPAADDVTEQEVPHEKLGGGWLGTFMESELKNLFLIKMPSLWTITFCSGPRQRGYRCVCLFVCLFVVNCDVMLRPTWLLRHSL